MRACGKQCEPWRTVKEASLCIPREPQVASMTNAAPALRPTNSLAPAAKPANGHRSILQFGSHETSEI